MCCYIVYKYIHIKRKKRKIMTKTEEKRHRRWQQRNNNSNNNKYYRVYTVHGIRDIQPKLKCGLCSEHAANHSESSLNSSDLCTSWLVIEFNRFFSVFDKSFAIEIRHTVIFRDWSMEPGENAHSRTGTEAKSLGSMCVLYQPFQLNERKTNEIKWRRKKTNWKAEKEE